MFAGNVRDGPDGLSDAAIGWRQTEQQPASWEVAMTTVYVFMESCGDKYSVEWVYLDRDQSYRFARTTQDSAGETGPGRAGADQRSTGAYDGPY